MNEMTQEDEQYCCFKISAFEGNGYVEVSGPGNMNIAPILKDICFAMINEGKLTIFINMDNCTIVDSTFMGTLLNIQDNIEEKDPDNGKLLIFNLNEENKKLFAMVGIDRFLTTVSEEVEIPDFKLKTIDMCDVDREEKLRVVVEAHEKLIEINEVNKDKFERFLSIVKQEMKEEGIEKNE
jgi:anti-anti-sigma factor